MLQTQGRAVLARATLSEVRRREQERVRRLSLWHKIAAFTTLASMTATIVVGDVNALQTFEYRLPSQTMLWLHRGLAVGTSTVFLGASLFRWLEPSAYYLKRRSPRLNFWLKLLSWVHVIALVGVVTTGLLNARVIPNATPGKLAMTATHMVFGYTSWGALAAATTITFF